MKRLGEGDEESLRQTVLAKYEVLASIYQNMYQDRGTSGHPDSEMPLYLKKLLPVYDGWCFSPEWEAPRPVEHWAGRFLDQTQSLVDALSLADRNNLEAIEARILSRSTDYRLLLYGERLLRLALEEGGLQPSSDLRRRHRPDSLPLKEFLMALEAERMRAANGGGLTRALEAGRHRLRLYWLLEWGGMVGASIRGLGRRAGIYSERYKVEKAIRGEDIDDAYELILKNAPSEDCRELDNLGRWYLSILRRCAATRGDEERMLRVNATSTQRRAPKMLTLDRVWGRIAHKRLRNHLDYNLEHDDDDRPRWKNDGFQKASALSGNLEGSQNEVNTKLKGVIK